MTTQEQLTPSTNPDKTGQPLYQTDPSCGTEIVDGGCPVLSRFIGPPQCVAMALSPLDEEQTADQTASGTAHFAIAHPVPVGVKVATLLCSALLSLKPLLCKASNQVWF